jgi:hypothetical protein
MKENGVVEDTQSIADAAPNVSALAARVEQLERCFAKTFAPRSTGEETEKVPRGRVVGRNRFVGSARKALMSFFGIAESSVTYVEPQQSLARQAWLSWERLRILYNAVMLTVGLTLLCLLRLFSKDVGHALHRIKGGEFIPGKGALHGPGLWHFVLFVGVAANMLYLLGPVAEMCLYGLSGKCMGRSRYVLFAVGLLFSTYVLWAMAMRMWGHISGWLY